LLLMRIGIIYNEPASEGEPNWEASTDVMTQVQAVETSLGELGHEPVRLPFIRDLATFTLRLRREMITAAFNLCESVDDNPHLIGHPAAVLELLDIPFTGSSAGPLMVSTNKLLAKRVLQGAGIQTPAAYLYQGEQNIRTTNVRFPLILKPQFEDASIGIDQNSVVSDPAQLLPALQRLYDLHGPILIEEYISGREFNISLFGFPTPEVMPLAEIDFSGFPDGLHKIVGYKAKWDPDSLEYKETRRIFPDNLPWHFASQMASVALECFHLFGLRDYGRVDLRLDEDNSINVLEINANPCLSPDAGFAAAVAENGRNYTDMVDLFLQFIAARKHS
jgi:D-alanine-D-alanine ligase